jgi:N-acetylglucosaminyldiphosphoundecaprenol N-acetyl-beta-D-mannosaminyltransferase
MAAEQAIAAVRFGPLRAHAVTLSAAIDLICRRAHSGAGGFVLTPNVDHLAQARRNPELRAAYERAFLSLVDGMPLLLISRLLRLPIREKVSGSDLFEPLMARCARDGLPVFFLGATRDACERASEKLRRSHAGIRVAGHDSSFFDLDADPGAARAALRRARDLGARVVLACVPVAKQLMLYRFEEDYRPAVGIGAGSALAFYAGEVRRAPSGLSRLGLEWLYRLAQEPRRLWRRYLVEDSAALPILLGMVLDRARGRTLHELVQRSATQAEANSNDSLTRVAASAPFQE